MRTTKGAFRIGVAVNGREIATLHDRRPFQIAEMHDPAPATSFLSWA
jgi:hypothetical protein